MTGRDRFSGEIEDLLDEYEGPPSLPERLRDAVLADVASTRQSGRLAWPRYPKVASHLSSPMPYMLAAATVAAVALVGALFFIDRSRGFGDSDTTAEPTAVRSSAERSSAVADGDEVRWTIQYENHSPRALALWRHEDGMNAGSTLDPCMAGEFTVELVAPFEAYLGPEAPDGVLPVGARGWPLVLDSEDLATPPGELGYRITIDAQGRLADIVPADAPRDPLVEQLC